MDGSHFDALTRSLISPCSRRGLTRFLRALLLGGVLALASVPAQAKKKGGKGKKGKRKRTRRCIPTCAASKPCGPDGCEGSCGACVRPETCQSGRCRCVPDCAGKTCDDDDGCGTPCITCSGGSSCIGGNCTCPGGQEFCQGSCVPSCTAPEVQHPTACFCCSPAGTPQGSCSTAFCCGGSCTPTFPDEPFGPGSCPGIASGDGCSFDEQCASGECQDFGPEAGTCE